MNCHIESRDVRTTYYAASLGLMACVPWKRPYMSLNTVKDSPRQLPNVLLYLGALVSRRQITPDLRVKNISHVDWPGLRRRGYNAVVIDKDNCLTWPDRDELYPPLSAGWSHLRNTFGTGRVLVVSNSSGTPKDHGGLSAEAVSRQLGVPVLLHQLKKPGCATDVLAYFRGSLQPVALSSTPAAPTLDIKGLEDVDMLIPSPRIKQRKVIPPPTIEEPSHSPTSSVAGTFDEAINILVVGDRQFTDSLLAHRLSLHLSSPPANAPPRVLSIHTTILPQPSDVRALRWLETFLSPGIKQSPFDWGRYILSHEFGTTPTGAVKQIGQLSYWGKTKRVVSIVGTVVRWVVNGVKRMVAAFRKTPAAGSTSDLPPNSLPLDLPVDGGRFARILTRLKSRLPWSRVVTRE